MKPTIGRYRTGRLPGAAENEEVNRMLSSEDEILPSSGFAAAVMDAVRREAAVPPPIPFPWKRALPGMIVAGLVFVLAVMAVVAVIVYLPMTSTIPHVSTPPSSLGSLGLHGGIESATAWTVLALLLAFVSVKLSMSLATGRP
jgi:hypothetical protein